MCKTSQFDNTLFVIGDPNWPMPAYSKIIADDLMQLLPGIKFDQLYDLYPDLDIDPGAEQKKLMSASTIILQCPTYCYSLPSLIISWVEEVLDTDWARGGNTRPLAGKKVLVSTTASAPSQVFDNGAMKKAFAKMAESLNDVFEDCDLEYLGCVFTGGLINTGTRKPDPDGLEQAHLHATKVADKVKANLG